MCAFYSIFLMLVKFHEIQKNLPGQGHNISDILKSLEIFIEIRQKFNADNIYIFKISTVLGVLIEDEMINY